MASTLCFLHIPKTAGTALVRSIVAQYHSPGSVLSAYGREHEIPQIVGELSPEVRLALRFVVGHMAWTSCEAIPNRVLCSFVRHPVERMWSDYIFIRNWPKHPLSWRALEENVTFPEFMTKPPWRLNRNLLVRSFSTPDKPEIDESDLEVALENARKRFAFIGVCERMRESVAGMSRVFGPGMAIEPWQYVVNVASHKPTIPPEWRELAEKENRLDLAFYHEIDAMLGQWKAVEPVKIDGPTIGSYPRGDLDGDASGRVRFNIEEISYNRDALVIAGWAIEGPERKTVACVYLRCGETLLAQNLPTFPRPGLFPANASRGAFRMEAHCASVLAAKSPLYLGFLLADRSGVVEKVIEP